jgi:hypothetical protein
MAGIRFEGLLLHQVLSLEESSVEGALINKLEAG